MEKPDDITAPSAQGRQIPQYNVLHSALKMRLEEALSCVSDCTEEMAPQIECSDLFHDNWQVPPPFPPINPFIAHKSECR